MSRDGVLFIATGERHILGANSAAKSVRDQLTNVQVDLYCDKPEFVENEWFDQVHLVSDPHRRSKVDYIPLTRFDRTLYLDTDIRVVADISDIFSILDRFDIALAHAHSRNRAETQQIWRKVLPSGFPQLNGGVILYKSSEKNVINLMEAWKKAFHEQDFKKDQTTLRELIWDSDLKLYVLPPEYNIRYEKYLQVWEQREAVPKILHFARFKNEIVTSDPDNDTYEPQSRSLRRHIRKIFKHNLARMRGMDRDD